MIFKTFKPHAFRNASLMLAGGLVSALAMVALPAGAQGTQGARSAQGGAAGLARADSKMMGDLSESNHAEIEASKLALEKSQNPQVKKFAQQMIDDHTAAQTELETMAQSKGVKLPQGTDAKHKTLATAMGAMKGDTFDSQYGKHTGVADHQSTIALLQKVQKDAKDPELKAMATKMLPIVKQHLDMAQQMSPASAKK